MALLLPLVVGLVVVAASVAVPFAVPPASKSSAWYQRRQLLVINIPLSLVCFYLLWLMAYLSQMHLFQLPELMTPHKH